MSESYLDQVLQDGALVIDASTLEGHWMRCPRSFYYYKLRKREAAKLYIGRDFGKCMHEGLAARNEGKDWLSVIDATYPTDIPIDDHRTCDYAKRLCKIHTDEYSAEAFTTVKHNGALCIEQAFAHPIGSVTINDLTIPIIWEGRIDRMVRDANNRLFVLDYKTASMGGETYWAQFKTSTQMLGYCFVANAILGEQCHGYIIDGLFTLRETRTGKGPHVERRMFPVDEDDLRKWHTNTLNVCADLLQCAAQGRFNMHTGECVRRYGPCQYQMLCALSQEVQREALLRSMEYQDVTWRPTE